MPRETLLNAAATTSRRLRGHDPAFRPHSADALDHVFARLFPTHNATLYNHPEHGILIHLSDYRRAVVVYDA